MYPYRPSRISLVIMLIIALLASAFLTTWKRIIPTALAHYSEINNAAQAHIRSGDDVLAKRNTAVSNGGTIDVRVSTADDDAEQHATNGYMYLDSSDLELINDPGVAKDNQTVGMRFTGISIPRGSTITQAYIEFQVDEASSEATSIVFHGQAADNAGTFTHTSFDISNRAKTSAATSWNDIPAWNTIGAKVQTPDLSAVVQEIVNRNGWASGNSLVIIVDGSGRRVASAYESGAQTAALLHITYNSPAPPPTATAVPPSPTSLPTSTSFPPTLTNTPVVTTPPPSPTNTSAPPSQSSVIEIGVSAGNDDAEQRVGDGYMYFNSSDLELTNDPGVAKDNQSVGMRFNGVTIPRGSTITQAYIVFQVDETSSEATSIVFHGQAADNAGAFSSAAYNLSSRAKTSAAVSWNNIPAWNTVGARQQTPDLSSVIQEVVNRSGWVAGNSLVIIVDGSGRRVASSYESGASIAAKLHIAYSPSSGGGILPPPPTPTTNPTSTSLPPTPTRTPTAQPPTPTRTPTTQPPTPTRTPTSPPSGGSPTPVGQSGTWRLVFDDEFNGTTLDSSKWRTCFWWADTTCSIETNHELELYNSQDVLVQNGLLRLRAQRRDMVAWNGVTYHYTSGMVMTGGRSGQVAPGFQFKYGYAEALVKVPAGQGLWPAFWMLPTSYNSRPEIDIMEILGDTVNQYHMNYHYVGGDSGSTWTGPDFSAGWHVLGLDWEPNAIVWYVDGVERWRYTDTAHISSEPEYLLLNLAVGGDWPGAPNSTTPFPSTYDIDYVRVWQH